MQQQVWNIAPQTELIRFTYIINRVYILFIIIVNVIINYYYYYKIVLLTVICNM